ncbi:hypothetical protein SEUCBS139899_004461 [Sporothrix eucalyptigena]|uniref:Uncharacterized protein n=1 Tax=Sporothrix eucalyptigena TaxID=1812306 RepID=A0ABP0BHK5_9PEZI
MRPLIILTTLAATASASPFRLWAPPSPATTPASTKASNKDKSAVVSHKFDQYANSHHPHNLHDKQKQHDKQHEKTKPGQHTHHRLPLHGNNYAYGYSYRYQRSNNNPGKAVVYAPDRSHAVHTDGKPAAKASSQSHKIRAFGDLDAAALTEPPPCQPMSPPPDEEATKARFDQFAHAFLVTKNITEAFTYISQGYINHNPAAKNGAASAWGILSPIWASQSITVLRTTFKGNMGWLNYKAGGLGEVVDRYRWDAGCIVEHWDQGEKYPST